MPEEVFVGLIMGFWVGAPVGWFLKAAFTWRRDAKRLTQSEAKPAPVVETPTPINARLEKLMERLSQRLETVEDRLEFTERLLDARTPGRGSSSRRLTPATRQSEAGESRD
jgi:hypothetical protein